MLQKLEESSSTDSAWGKNGAMEEKDREGSLIRGVSVTRRRSVDGLDAVFESRWLQRNFVLG